MALKRQVISVQQDSPCNLITRIANLSMANQGGAPDSWESIDNSENDASVTKSFTGLNVSAKPFVPNVNAAVFVPSFARSQPAPPQTVAGNFLQIITIFSYFDVLRCLYALILITGESTI